MAWIPPVAWLQRAGMAGNLGAHCCCTVLVVAVRAQTVGAQKILAAAVAVAAAAYVPGSCSC